MHVTQVKYAGVPVNQDRVNWYDMPLDRHIGNYFNTGDICVYESTLRLLGERSGDHYLNVEKPVDAETVARLKDKNSILVLRGSNYLHEHMEWDHFGDWLEALNLRVIVCGVGAQAESARPIDLPPANRRVWKLISERCESIGVRGAFTAETLRRNGVENVEIVGCPTLFRARDRSLSLRHAAGGPRRVSFSIRREVGPDYAVDPHEFVEVQKRLIAKLDMVCDLYLSCHGEPEEKAYFFRSPDAKEAALAKLVKSGWFDHMTGATLRRLYESKLYYFSRPSDYDHYARQFDAAIGYRVHAVLPAVALGVPGVLFDYDTRSRELAETFDLPIYSPAEFERMTLAEALDPQRFAAFEARFAERYDGMKRFLERNGARTRM